VDNINKIKSEINQKKTQKLHTSVHIIFSYRPLIAIGIWPAGSGPARLFLSSPRSSLEELINDSF